MAKLFTAAFAVVVLAVALFAPAAEAQTECVSKLVPCASFLNSQTRPSTECCDSIKDAVRKDLACLCTIYTTPGLLNQFNVTVDQALALSRRCGVSTDLSACKSVGAPAPGSLPPPPGTPGSDEKDASNRITGAGIAGLVLMLVSWVFY